MRLFLHLDDGGRLRSSEQRAGLGDVGGDHRHEREDLAQGADGVLVEEAVSARRDHHRVEHDRDLAHAGEEGPDRAHSASGSEHADLDRVDPDVVEQRDELETHEVVRHRMHAGDSQRVLSGQRRRDGQAEGAEGAERLEIGLEAGASRRVAAGDREEVGDRVHAIALVPRQDRTSSRVAASTSSRPQIALTTAAPAAPVARTIARRPASTPPIATQGQGLAATICASASGPHGSAASGFVFCAQTGPMPR
ncbi:hypothetical protein GCM10025867_29550 [Frondihabitans sucicola]|uniref:Uncharacterized protein n=1 Tax=Frondihabitans sucicola TaxID=1268041 RepID=A0ABM8GQG5_9MICO|nr:hypothetical protein GCM10025867_29550 [Frondihabitans sucicola]